MITARLLEAAILATVLSVPVTRACTCGSLPTPIQSLEKSDIVVSGYVTSITHSLPTTVRGPDGREGQVTSSADLRRWDIAVTAVWKGDAGDTLQVYSAMGSSCGYEFTVGKEYLIYGRYLRWQMYDRGVVAGPPTDSLIIEVGACRRTKPLSLATEDVMNLPCPVRVVSGN
jgi:hypothetical protein